jgi:hypothetical protein
MFTFVSFPTPYHIGENSSGVIANNRRLRLPARHLDVGMQETFGEFAVFRPTGTMIRVGCFQVHTFEYLEQSVQGSELIR